MSNDLDSASVFATLDTWAARFGGRFILGLSGGGDSMALAVLLAKWQKRGVGQVLVVSIDHNLRDGSLADSQQACAWAEQLGLAAQIIHITEPWAKTRIQEVARNRRHSALANQAQAFGARVILLAHTLEDQAETIAYRLSRSTGLEGLAGMANLAPSPQSSTAWPCLVGRPLLSTRRADLRSFLKNQNQNWIEDPANTNDQFARIRVRKRLAELGSVDQLISIGQHAQALRETIDAAVDEFARRYFKNGRLNAPSFLEADPTLKAALLRRLLIAAGAPNRPFAIEKIDSLLRDMARYDFRSATLAHVQISRKNEAFVFAAAPPRSINRKKMETSTHL
jgi:tRNA(Ile)-lysidine synthase